MQCMEIAHSTSLHQQRSSSVGQYRLLWPAHRTGISPGGNSAASCNKFTSTVGSLKMVAEYSNGRSTWYNRWLECDFDMEVGGQSLPDER